MVFFDSIMVMGFSRWLALLIPLILSVTHFLGLHSNSLIKKKKAILRSFSSGFSIAYVFLFLLPELPKLSLELGVDTALLTLIGFSIFHLSHKSVFVQTGWFVHKRQWLEEIHLVTALTYNFLITFSLVEVTVSEFSKGMLLAGVFILHVGLIELSHPYGSKKYIERIKLPLLIAATMIGGVLPLLGVFNRSITTVLFAMTAGAIIYTAIREELPKEADGNPWWFVLGVSSPAVAALWIL